MTVPVVENEKTVSEKKAESQRSEGAAEEQSEGETPIGKVIADAREKRGLSQADASREARIPAYYVRMIESDNYALIADQLYLLPFLRRYASFLRLDPEDVASRFVREVQRADASASRMSEPIPMVDKKPGPRRLVLLSIVIVLALGAIAFFAFMRAVTRNSTTAPVPSPAATSTSQGALSVAPAAPVRSAIPTSSPGIPAQSATPLAPRSE